MTQFDCSYLSAPVELSAEREQHPDLLPRYHSAIAETLDAPDQVRRSTRFASARLFSRWFGSIRGGKHVVVVVVENTAGNRHGIITAYLARKLAEGGVEWKKS